MDKPIIFISHITEESKLAIELKNILKEGFLDMIDIFVSSDEENIGAGDKWLDEITTNLKSCAIELILCSPQSLKRPWINFEAGAGWIRGIPVIPLCHSGVSPDKLPKPLDMLQGVKLNSQSNLRLILPTIANALGSAEPKIDFKEFVEGVKRFEKDYMYTKRVKDVAEALTEFDAELIHGLKQNLIFEKEYEDHKVMKLKTLFENIADLDLCSIAEVAKRSTMSSKTVNGLTTKEGGTYIKVEIKIKSEFQEYL